MKKNYLILLVSSFVFCACETDIDVNSSWEEVTVVYGLLDHSQQKQYIKINKGYLGEEDAFYMANIADSINYVNSVLEVLLYKIENQDTVVSDPLEADTTILKQEGVFASAIGENIIYTTVEEDSSFVEADKNYMLTIRNTETGKLVVGKTGIVSVPEDFIKSTFQPFPFRKTNDPNVPDSLEFNSKTIEWYSALGIAEVYQVDLKFNYRENNISKSLVWTQPLVGSSSSMQTRLEGVKFFKFIINNLDYNEGSQREFIDLDLIITIGSRDLATYIAINMPYEGLVQERPSYTNVTNGLGLFSSRYTYQRSGIALNTASLEYLKSSMVNRNFE